MWTNIEMFLGCVAALTTSVRAIYLDPIYIGLKDNQGQYQRHANLSVITSIDSKWVEFEFGAKTMTADHCKI